MAEITEWVKKIWKNRITEFPTRRELTKEDGSSEIVTVTRNEGTVSEEGDAFDADTMNNLEERIDAGFADVTRNLSVRYNADTDTIQVCYNDQWIDWEAARIQATVLFDGIAGTGLATDLITGFTQINASYGTSYSVSSEHITMSGTGNNTSGTIQPRFRSANTIDITSYSKLIIECESVFNSGAPAVGFTADASKKPSTGNIITLSIGTNELDISGLSGAYYLWFDGVTNTNGTAKIRKISLK